MTDPDAPTLLVYAPAAWGARRDRYGDPCDDDDCGDYDDLYAGWGWSDADTDYRALMFDPNAGGDCGDGLPDAPEPAPHTHDLCPF